MEIRDSPRSTEDPAQPKINKLDIYVCVYIYMASCIAQLVKNLPVMLETWVRLLDWEDSLEKDIARSQAGYSP